MEMWIVLEVGESRSLSFRRNRFGTRTEECATLALVALIGWYEEA